MELRWQRPQLEIPLPPAINKNIISYNIRPKFNVYSDGTHTHTPCLRQGGARKNEMKMRMNGGWKLRWEWKWDERYLTRTRRGERKRRGKEQTHTNTPSPERANPEKAREKKKAEGRRTRTKTSGGGGRRKRLNQPATAKTYKKPQRATEPTYLGREESMR